MCRLAVFLSRFSATANPLCACSTVSSGQRLRRSIIRTRVCVGSTRLLAPTPAILWAGHAFGITSLFAVPCPPGWQVLVSLRPLLPGTGWHQRRPVFVRLCQPHFGLVPHPFLFFSPDGHTRVYPSNTPLCHPRNAPSPWWLQEGEAPLTHLCPSLVKQPFSYRSLTSPIPSAPGKTAVP